MKALTFGCTNAFTNQDTTHKHVKYPEHSPMNLFGSLLTITYGCLSSWQAFRKTFNGTYGNSMKTDLKVIEVSRNDDLPVYLPAYLISTTMKQNYFLPKMEHIKDAKKIV